MTRHRKLHPGYERLIGMASVDSSVRMALLHDPHRAALDFGLTPDDAAIAADIRACDLHSFAAALLPRLYGKGAANVPFRHAVAG